MNDKIKKIIICIFAIALLCSICFILGRKSFSRQNAELSTELEASRNRIEYLDKQLELRIEEVRGMQSELNNIGNGIDESIGLVGQAGRLINDIGETVQDVGDSSGDIGETIRQVKRNNLLIRRTVEDLQESNRKLENELRGIQRSTSK